MRVSEFVRAVVPSAGAAPYPRFLSSVPRLKKCWSECLVSAAPSGSCIRDRGSLLQTVSCPAMQIQQGMLWVWGEKGPTAFIDAASKTPAVTRVSSRLHSGGALRFRRWLSSTSNDRADVELRPAARIDVYRCID